MFGDFFAAQEVPRCRADKNCAYCTTACSGFREAGWWGAGDGLNEKRRRKGRRGRGVEGVCTQYVQYFVFGYCNIKLL